MSKSLAETARDKRMRDEVFRGRANALRAESIAGFLFLRNSQMPHMHSMNGRKELSDHYVFLRSLSDAQVRAHGAEIFDTIVNYLRLLAAKRLFPKHSLLDCFVVRLDPACPEVLSSCQIFNEYLQSRPCGIGQLEELRAFLRQEHRVSLPTTKDPMDLYFPQDGSFELELGIEDVAKQVRLKKEIDIIQDELKLIVIGDQVMDNEDILLSQQDTIRRNPLALWIVLARFVRSRQAISNIQLIPDWLDEYVRYDEPRELPDYMHHVCGPQRPVEQLRVVLGVYPVRVRYYDLGDTLTPAQRAVVDQLPLWYQQRVV